jgi:hypothetical protein
MAIALVMASEQRYRFAAGAEDSFREYLELRRQQPRFANGRSVRNALDRARLRQAIRIYDAAHRHGRLTKGDLVTIADDDVRASRVFDGGFYRPGSCGR